MNVEFIKEENETNDALLDFENIQINNKEILKLWHSNSDDGYYSYEFHITGTDDELRIIKEFCNKIMEAE